MRRYFNLTRLMLIVTALSVFVGGRLWPNQYDYTK